MRLVFHCLLRPSEKPELAADGELQHDYRKKQVTKHSVVRSSEVAAKSETTRDEHGFHEAKGAINAEAHAMPMSTKTKSKTSRSSTPRGSLEDDKADKAPSKKALWMRAASATKPKKQWNNLKTLSRKGKAAQCSSPSPTSPRCRGVARCWRHGRPRS